MMVNAEEVSANRGIIHCQFSAEHLEKKDFLGKSDPFLVLSKQNPDGSFTAVHKTEWIKQNLNPTWKPIQTTLTALCNGVADRGLKVRTRVLCSGVVVTSLAD